MLKSPVSSPAQKATQIALLPPNQKLKETNQKPRLSPLLQPIMSSSNDFSAAATAPLSTIATAMLFGTITFATAALATRTWLTADTRAIVTAMHNPKSQALDTSSFISVYSLLHHFTVFGLILFFAYVCEYHPPFPHSEKVYDRDEFFFLTALVIVVSMYTVHRNDSSLNHNSMKKSSANNGKGGGGSSSSSTSSLTLEQKLQTISESPSRSKNGGSAMSMNGSNSHSNHEVEAQTMTNGSTIADDSTYTSYTTTGLTTLNTQGTMYYIQAAPTKACDDLLNRDQTEEWKGWMQFVFLLYHYYHAEEVYNSIRVMITCYVWMTGFGNFSFF